MPRQLRSSKTSHGRRQATSTQPYTRRQAPSTRPYTIVPSVTHQLQLTTTPPGRRRAR